MPTNGFEEAELLAKAEAWIAEVEDAYRDGGYAHGDGPTPPLDEMIWLLAERAKALRIIDAWHQLANRLERMAEAMPQMWLADAYKNLRPDFERIEEAKRG